MLQPTSGAEVAILGSTRPSRPHEASGGILANEMGLGKTLTVIAAVIRSIDLAISFSKSRERGTAILDTRTKVATKSTLIIAPSVCEYP